MTHGRLDTLGESRVGTSENWGNACEQAGTLGPGYEEGHGPGMGRAGGTTGGLGGRWEWEDGNDWGVRWG